MTKLDKLLYDYSISHLVSNNTIELDGEDLDKLNQFVKEVIAVKQNESHHQIDSNNESKRWFTGLGGELALQKILGESFVDLSVGNSIGYHTPDLSKLGLSVGIKTVEYGKYPVIFKKSYKPEIIILKTGDKEFSVLGLATVNVLNKYQDDNKILSHSLRARGTKTGFIGLHKLKPFNNLEDLKKLV